MPPLGRHYSHCWAVEDLEEEGSRGGRAMENIEPRNNANTNWQKESGLLISIIVVFGSLRADLCVARLKAH